MRSSSEAASSLNSLMACRVQGSRHAGEQIRTEHSRPRQAALQGACYPAWWLVGAAGKRLSLLRGLVEISHRLQSAQLS